MLLGCLHLPESPCKGKHVGIMMQSLKGIAHGVLKGWFGFAVKVGCQEKGLGCAVD